MIAKSHYEDCPYNCNQNGMLLDSNTGNMVQCQHCSKIKKELLKQGYVETEDEEQVSLNTVLGIESKYLSTKFVYNSIIPDGEMVFIDPDSLRMQEEIAEELYLNLTVGVLPEVSYCFGISVKGKVDRFVYPMLAKAYLANLTVGKFLSCSEFYRLSFEMDPSISELYTAEVVFMLINDGGTLADISAAKGLMQSRALKGLPTIFITTWTIEACSGLIGFKDEADLFMARGVFVKYKSSKGHSRYINGLLGVENETISSQSSGDIGISMKDL